MAIRVSKSTLGEMTGSVGNITISKWRTLTVIRNRSSNRDKNKISEKQHKQNEIFKLVQQPLKPIQDIIKLGYQQSKKTAMTPMNAAMSYHMLNAVIDGPEYPRIDPAKIKISHSIWSTQNLWKPVLSASVNKRITLEWELNPYPQKCARLDDKVIIQFYQENGNYFHPVIEEPARYKLRVDLTFARFAIGLPFHAYLFVVSADGKLVSPTAYLGIVTVLP